MYQYVGQITPGQVAALRPLIPPSVFVSRADSGYRLENLEHAETETARGVLAGIVPVDKEWIAARAIVIKPTGLIHLHSDPQPDGQAANVRYHVAIDTNPYAFVYHDGTIQHLPEGSVYTVDEKQDHASVNWGKTPRLHLVIDVPK